ncbi:hypothetical protein SS50377_23655 [Spironucleus salmonicida]|uniref:Uncharacterized protein n=1 Tax=Spironucleus salmonicida TaxID=348837 RepID=V6LWL1_9EUKA|nr:hypothetical protein SS50377_23655 [Spironucleus salmonicida]|eukprot:EST48638.1 Hypothetical protein SS50377_11251 [Spironucleus salmonicida]
MSQLPLSDQGTSRHYPTMKAISNSLFDLMQAISNSNLNKKGIYKHLLKAADFVSFLLTSEAIYSLARKLDENSEILMDKTLTDTMKRHQFLKKNQISRACLNVIRSKFRPNSEQFLIQILTQEFEKTSLKRTFFRTKQHPLHVVLFDFQLDVTLTFSLLCFYLFTQDVVFEAFDEYQNVEIQTFQFKEFVFNIQSAPRFVDFWFPAFSKDEKVIFQARYIENDINYDIAGDDEDFKENMMFQNDIQFKDSIIRENVKNDPIAEKVNYRELVQEEVSRQIEPLKQQMNSLDKKLKNLTDQNSILSASQQKILLDFDKMFNVVRELNDSIIRLAGRKK